MKKISGNPYLIRKDGNIYLDSIPLDEILNKFKTPLYIFLENRIRDNVNSLIKTFNETFNNIEFFYSFKANYLPEMCKIICSEGIGAKLVGLPELKLALKIGFSPDKIIIGGPYLPENLIKSSIKNKVKEIIVYNLRDLKTINLIAEKNNWVQNVCLRLNSRKYNSKLGLKLTYNELKTLEDSIKKYKNIKITSVLSHFGTQMNNIDLFERNINSLILNLDILSNHNIHINNLNIGGGFPEATVMGRDQLRRIAEIIKIKLEESTINYQNIYLEPGRYFVGDSGLFLTKIVKTSEDRWIFLDIGNHICPKFARCSLRFYNASQIDEAHKFKTSIAGIVPTDQDVLAKDYFFTHDLHENDIVLVTNTGAYCLTFSNRFPYALPVIVLIEGNTIKTIFDPDYDKDFSLN
ncbi:MAG: diaminopimelate decarboxylase family protein [Promethearchaeota archaeon]